MLSATFHSVPITKITVERDARQRRELTDIEELADSISRLGLINPITVTRDLVLVAGERRLTAMKSLGWDSAPCQFLDECPETTIRAIELEENIKRIDLPWQDRVAAVEAYHKLKLSENPDWSQEKTAESIGLTGAAVSKQLLVARELANPRVAQAPKYSVALGIVKRATERADEASVAQIKALEEAPREPVQVDSIVVADFNLWAPTYSGPRFNFIHCDFPYGIGMHHSDQGAGAALGAYDDSPDTYWTLCHTLGRHLDRLATPSCHLIFWFSMKFYRETLDFFARETDFAVEPFPLIWMKSDNVGILPDPSRGPRRVYETAFLARRGDRKIVQAVANAYAAPSIRNSHMSEKSESVLRHFFRMCVDETTLILDPTAGSGSALRAAESLGARHGVGLEMNPEFAATANAELNKARRLRNVK